MAISRGRGSVNDILVECLAGGAGNTERWYFAVGIVFVAEILNPRMRVSQMRVEDEAVVEGGEALG